MKNYKTLAVKYLKKNKKRSIITIFGVAISACLLFLILNLAWSFLLNARQQARKEHDYEIVLITETQEQIESILQNEKVKSAFVGSYYDAMGDTTYNNALFINTISPYRMNRIMEELQITYGVEGRFHNEVASTYLQGDEPDLFIITVLVVLLVSYIFAILGVGVVRNSIQLTIHEQIKDFGNLRCIGGSQKQLKAIIYLEGAILESTGIVIGVLMGTLLSMIVGAIFGVSSGFHWIPLLPIAICYYGDLCFAMNDNCKLVTKMSPVSAVRGEFRIRKEKIKLRKSGIFGKIFGVEGDYAYKNIRRNPGRFWKTVAAIVFGVAAMMTITSMIEIMNRYMEDEEKRNGYYQLSFEAIGDLTHSQEQLRASLPSQEQITELANMKGVGEFKKMYKAEVYLAGETPYDNMTDAFRISTEGMAIEDYIDRLERNAEPDKKDALESRLYQFNIYGYEKEDYERNQDNLIAGTLDVSENGIVIVNNTYTYTDQEDNTYNEGDRIDVPVTNYKIGDEIQIVNVVELRKRVQEEFAVWKKEESKKEEKDRADALDIQWEVINITNQCRHELIEEEQYETYIIEGILEHDANHTDYNLSFVLPLDNYYKVTGLQDGDYSGLQFHVSSEEVEDTQELYLMTERFMDDEKSYKIDWNNETLGIPETINVWYPLYLNMIALMGMDKDRFIMYGGLVLFIVILCCCNIINNISGSLYIRRKEFAQLRVIGISKNRLTKIVLLEGVITTIIANFFAILIGTIFSYIGSWTIGVVLGITYHFPIISALLGIVLSLILLCGTSYITIRGMKQNMASDLAASGE